MAVGPWTSVVSYHTDPEGCGVAKFSLQLADRLGVPVRALFHAPLFWGARPLLSVKWAELDSRVREKMLTKYGIFDQLWHDPPPKGYRPTGDVWKLYELGVPALVERPTMNRLALFTFGMAHKFEAERFARVRRQFGAIQLWISTAEHEGAGPSRVPDLMRLWGPSARDLGHLSDAALQLVWPHCVAFVAFFPRGLRANNTSVHAALDAGVPVLTNHGRQTPADLRAITIDVQSKWAIPVVRKPSPYTWDRLLQELGCAPSPSATG